MMPVDELENALTASQVAESGDRPFPPRSREATRRRNAFGWGFVALLLIVQFLLFRQRVIREVAWSYPPYHDQLTYLGRAYDTYERILDRGLRAGLSESEGFRHLKAEPIGKDVTLIPPRAPADPNPPLSPNGAFLHTQAAVLFLLIGPGRLNALLLCFIYLALFQCVVIATTLWLTGRWSIAFISLGWLLSCPSQFDGTGGIIDFRIDLTAMCLYGIFICLVIRSRIFSEWRWSALAGFCGAMLIGFRFIAAVYLAAVMSLVMAFLLAELVWLRKKPLARRAVLRQFMGALIACAIILLLAGPLILHHYPAIRDYYIANHMAGHDRQIRARGQGIKDLWTSLNYYPQSLYEFHAGPFFCWSAAWLIGFSLLVWAASRWSGKRRPAAPIDFVSAAVFVGCCLMVPFVLLSSDQDKTPVVADVMVGPFLWLFVLATAWLVTAYRERPVRWPVKWGLIAFATIILFTGMETQFTQTTRHEEMSTNRDAIESVIRLYDKIDEQCHAAGLNNPMLACDTLEDYIVPGALQVLTYERHGRLLNPGECMANTIDALTPDELLGQIRQADFVFLTEHAPPEEGKFEYPFETSVRRAKPQLLAYCKENLVEEGHARYRDRDITLYARPLLGIEGITSDGWVIRSGITVSTLAEFLRGRPVLQLCALTNGIPDRPVKVTARLQVEGREDVDVPATFAVGNGGCNVTLKVDPKTLPETGMVRVRLTFDGAASAPDVDARDIRGLIMRTPTAAIWSR